MAAINPEDLVIHILNVGAGDTIIVEFPEVNGNRKYGIVDCYKSAKTKNYMQKLWNSTPQEISFICATHPHKDHIDGIPTLLNNSLYRPKEFWDSGFRHNSLTYRDILIALSQHHIKMIRISSGMEWYFGKVRVTALAPSVNLRNRYATFGVDMNNASIVLRLEHHSDEVMLIKSREYEGVESIEDRRSAGKSVVILTGDAEFNSWAYVAQEYPHLVSSSKHKPLVKKVVNQLNCSVLKVSHHGSMHSAPFDIYETMSPKLAVISTKQKKSTISLGGTPYERNLFPHPVTSSALKENCDTILTTDGSYETEEGQPNNHPGTVVIVVPPGGSPRWTKPNDEVNQHPVPPIEV